MGEQPTERPVDDAGGPSRHETPVSLWSTRSRAVTFSLAALSRHTDRAASPQSWVTTRFVCSYCRLLLLLLLLLCLARPCLFDSDRKKNKINIISPSSSLRSSSPFSHVTYAISSIHSSPCACYTFAHPIIDFSILHSRARHSQ